MTLEKNKAGSSAGTPISTKAADTTTWENLYKGLGVDTLQSGEGYYDAVTSATNFTSRHAGDLPEIVAKTTTTGADGSETISNLPGVNLTGEIGAEGSAEVKVNAAKTMWTDSSSYGTDEFVVVPDDTVSGYVWSEYLKKLYAVTVSDGTMTVGAVPWIDFYGEYTDNTASPHYNKVQVALNSGTSVGKNAATVHRYDAFYENGKLKPGSYTVTLYAEGYQKLTATIPVYDYEYMYAALSWNEYWANEGVTGAGSDAASDVKDSNDELDKGAFDAVSRATIKHGYQRASYQTIVEISDTEGKTYQISHWSDDGKTVTLSNGKTAPSAEPSTAPSAEPSTAPSAEPSAAPSVAPSVAPSAAQQAEKKAAKITVKTTSKTVKAKKLKKKAQTFGIGASVDSKGTLSYKKVSGSARLTINRKTGKITVKKKTKKGSYKIKIQVTAAANGDYNAATVTKTIKVKVK